uniref:Uncharacterized protein n=1 Tax=Oryza glumipatula TaxID=40148 RepID=A0A0E0A571_9ORYZ
MVQSLQDYGETSVLRNDPVNAAPEGIDYNWAMKVIEIELAFVYEVFVGIGFIHWNMFCRVIAIPGTMSSHRTAYSPSGSTNVVDTMTADLLMHLIRCWTSNWARLAVACAYARNRKKLTRPYKTPYWRARWMRLKVFVATSTNWFEKYLWQDKIGQYSVLPEGRLTWRKKVEGRLISIVDHLYQECVRLVKMLGLDYIWEVLWDLLGNDDNKRAAVRLDDDLKASIIDFLGQIEDDRLEGNWLSFTKHQQEGEEKQKEREREKKRNQHVANALSKYCAYLLASAPELLPGPAPQSKRAYDNFVVRARETLEKDRDMLLGSMSDPEIRKNQHHFYHFDRVPLSSFVDGLVLANILLDHNRALLDATRRCELWETLALVWVRLLVHAAPYGNVEAHMQHLSRGGEFITHLWALLYHLDIREWKFPNKVRTIVTFNDFDRIGDDLAVDDGRSFLTQDDGRSEFATASRMENGVGFYQTSSRHVADRFLIDTEAGPALIWLNQKEDTFALYNGKFRAHDIARFVSANKLALAKRRAQSSGNEGQTEDGIEEEIQPQA